MEEEVSFKEITICIVLFIILIAFFIFMATVVNKMDNNFLENCMKNGYSEEYCERSK